MSVVVLEICDLFVAPIDLHEYQRFFHILKFDMNCDVYNEIVFLIVCLLLSDKPSLKQFHIERLDWSPPALGHLSSQTRRVGENPGNCLYFSRLQHSSALKLFKVEKGKVSQGDMANLSKFSGWVLPLLFTLECRKKWK